MAKVRIGFSTQFELENELVGIGTDNPTNTLQALGNIHTPNAKSIGVSTLTVFDGFVDSKAAISGLEGSEQGSISGEIVIEGSATVSAGATFRSGPENLTVTDNFTLPGISDDKPSVGTTRFNEDLGSLEFYTGVEWKAVNSYTDMGNRGRGLFAGGGVDGVVGGQMITYVEISTLGDDMDFGSLDEITKGRGGCASRSRGIFAGGHASSGNADADIDYITIASKGDTIHFGDLSVTHNGGIAGCSNQTRGFISGGSGVIDVIDYFEIATLGNGLDFGNLNTGRDRSAGCASATRGFNMAGYTPTYLNDINFWQISSKGNSQDFGDLSYAAVRDVSGGSNAIRGLCLGGTNVPNSNVGFREAISFFSMASTGNAEDFGDMTHKRGEFGTACSQIRAVIAGGKNKDSSPVYQVREIDYINIASAGRAMSFGMLSYDKQGATACSDSHGGL